MYILAITNFKWTMLAMPLVNWVVNWKCDKNSNLTSSSGYTYNGKGKFTKEIKQEKEREKEKDEKR